MLRADIGKISGANCVISCCPPPSSIKLVFRDVPGSAAFQEESLGSPANLHGEGIDYRFGE